MFISIQHFFEQSILYDTSVRTNALFYPHPDSFVHQGHELELRGYGPSDRLHSVQQQRREVPLPDPAHHLRWLKGCLVYMYRFRHDATSAEDAFHPHIWNYSWLIENLSPIGALVLSRASLSTHFFVHQDLSFIPILSFLEFPRISLNYISFLRIEN